MTAGWEAGHAVIAALACWVVAVGILAGMVTAGVVRGVVGSWRWLYGRWSAPQAVKARREVQPPPSALHAHTAPPKPHAPA